MVSKKESESTKLIKTDSKKFIIIDGHAMAYRAHYALISHSLTNSKNEPIETTFGFFRMVFKLMKELSPDYFTLTFDPPGKNFRNELYSEYKANRKETPPELKLQILEIQTIAKSLEMPMLVLNGYEADDIIASLIKKFEKENMDMIIVSGDKDLFSLMQSNVFLYRPVKGVSEFKVFSDKDVVSEIGVKTTEIEDYMALTGDTSDNIPGVAGVGPKTASKLISEYHDLDNIYKNIDKMKPDGLKNKLIEFKDNAYLSKSLVTLKKDIELNYNINDFTWLNKPDIINKLSVFREKELPSIYDEARSLFPFISDSESVQKVNQINKNIQIITTFDEWKKTAEVLNKLEILAVDTETTSVHPMEAQLVGVSMSWKINEIYYSLYIPVVFDDKHERHFDYQNINDGKTCLEWIKPVLENASIKKIGQNIKYDYLVLLNHGVNLQNIYADTMVISYMINPNLRKHNLDDMAWRHLQHETIKYKDLTGTGKKAKELTELPLENLALYAAEDAEVTLRLYEILSKQLTDIKLDKLYQSIDGPMIGLLAVMEKNGILIDPEYLSFLEKTYMEKLNLIETSIFEYAGEKFNVNSTQELQEILFTKLQILSKKKTAGGGNLSTDASVLENIKDQHPVIEKILEYRTTSKLLNTYISALPRFINPKTGRIHTSFSQTIAATGRLASSEPNLQNIPIKGEEGNAIRKAFITPKGYDMLSLDYSQIELRILAHYSEDSNLIKAYMNDEDIHDQAAYLLFKHQFDPENSTWNKTGDFHLNSEGSNIDHGILKLMKASSEFSQKRSQAKILNFSIVYGVTEYGLSKNLSISIEEARNLIALYFINYPGIKKYMNETVEHTREVLYSENLFGRKRTIEDIQSKNRFSREAAERLAINNPIQSTAADLIKVAMLKIQKLIEKENLKSKLLLQIHDELLLEVPEEEKGYTFNLVKNEMENVIQLKVPLKVSGGFGKNWGEVK
ncbi:MAG: DNA polymerase I [Spirochaetia bacterium]|nr:DNA polymerase I [Spirochaetia bacterium]